MKKIKKAQVEESLVKVIFYLALLVVLIFIVWYLLSGRAPELFKSITDKLRFG